MQKLIIHRISKLPEGYDNYDSVPFSEFDIERINSLGIHEIWYWYGSGDWCGTGELLMRKGNLYDLHYCGHCSCYGPTDDIKFIGYTLAKLKKSCTLDRMKSTKCLFDAISKRNRRKND